MGVVEMKTPYLTIERYCELLNEKIDEKEFSRLLLIAEEKINSVSKNRIVGLGFVNLTEFQKEKVELATAFQIQYLLENGLEDDNLSSYSVLDISINVDKTNQSISKKLHMSSIAYSYMQDTGLCTNNFRWQ